MSASESKWIDSAPILYSVDRSVATITLNRPERMNAVTPQMLSEFHTQVRACDDDPDVRVIVITGAGKAFCAGADVGRLSEVTIQAGGKQTFGDQVAGANNLFTIRKPLIAAINGACAGVGLVFAIHCDLRFAASDASISTAFARRGLVAEYGVAWLLPRIIGLSRASDLLLSARKIKAPEAKALGLVDYVTDPEDLLTNVYAYARDLADNVSPTSMAIMKSQIRRQQTMDFGPAMIETNEAVNASLQRDDLVEGVNSYLEKRKPEFAPLPPQSI